eukprot:364639-Chlamydomonas_euryale.AAC.28
MSTRVATGLTCELSAFYTAGGHNTGANHAAGHHTTCMVWLEATNRCVLTLPTKQRTTRGRLGMKEHVQTSLQLVCIVSKSISARVRKNRTSW